MQHGAGLGYGLALALVTRLAMAAFALSGTLLSSLLAQPIRQADPAAAFLIIGIVIVLAGLVAAALLPPLQRSPPGPGRAERAGPIRREITDPKFLRLALIWFFICYTGLMVVAHSTGIVLAQGGGETLIGLTPGIFTFGYIPGALAGGRLVEMFSGRTMLVVSNLFAGAGLALFLLPASPLVLAGALAVGMVSAARPR